MPLSYTSDHAKNFASTYLAGGPGGAGSALSPSDTSMTVTAGTGGLLPATPFYLTLGSGSPAPEVVQVTARSGDALTLVRGQDGTTAATWAAGTLVQHNVVAANVNNLWTTIQSIVTAFNDGTGVTVGAANVLAGTLASNVDLTTISSDGGKITSDGSGNLTVGGALSGGQSATAPALASSGTITTTGVSVARVAPAGNVTGVILQAGTSAGQEVIVVNESAFTITLAASGTSHVADGAADIIAAASARQYTWDSGTSLWYAGGGAGGGYTSGDLTVSGSLSTAQSGSAAVTATSGTITTASIGVARVAPTGNITGIILQAGTHAGQEVKIVNESAFTITFAASGTSNVADGVSDIIAATSGRTYAWDSGTSLWYPLGGSGGGGGGGASTSDHFLVGMGGQGDTDLTNRLVIPGLSGSPDVRVGGANDDEFDQNTSGAPAGWTSFGPDSPAFDTNTVKSHFHYTCNSNASATNLNGILKAAPAIPYTVTAKITDFNGYGNYTRVQLSIFDANTTNKVLSIGHEFNTGSGNTIASLDEWTNWTTYSGNAGVIAGFYPYVRFVVHSANNIDVRVSRSGLSWMLVAAGVNFLANATYVGFTIEQNAATSYNPEGFVDWIRFS